jgi:hypothetical protein
MARGGFRANAGRPKGSKTPREKEPKAPVDVKKSAKTAQMLPLEYMLKVMNDDGAEEMRRDRMAVSAAPFVHAKPGEQGKKGQKDDAAKQAGKGRFAPSAPPKLVVNNKS